MSSRLRASCWAWATSAASVAAAIFVRSASTLASYLSRSAATSASARSSATSAQRAAKSSGSSPARPYSLSSRLTGSSMLRLRARWSPRSRWTCFQNAALAIGASVIRYVGAGRAGAEQVAVVVVDGDGAW